MQSRSISRPFFLLKTHTLSNNRQRQIPLPHRQKPLHQKLLLALSHSHSQSPSPNQSKRNSLKKLSPGMTGLLNKEDRREKCVAIISAPPTCASAPPILMLLRCA